tara:strand:+ start:521 stop:631 length:111 start_codon:yes stop_codon:yes gene_type:complete
MLRYDDYVPGHDGLHDGLDAERHGLHADPRDRGREL